MNTFRILCGLTMLATTASATAQPTSVVTERLIMTVTQDRHVSTDYFEAWTVDCTLDGRDSQCAIDAISFVTVKGSTFTRTWRHQSRAVRQTGPGVFHVEFNGRLNSCSGLTLVIRFVPGSHSRVDNLTGTMRAGSTCEHETVFTVDRTSPQKTLAPLINHGYRPGR